jgi:molybdate transport system substrate-binding protein
MLSYSNQKSICNDQRKGHGMNVTKSAWIAVLAITASCLHVVHAEEVKVLTAGAYKPVVALLAPEFEKESGHTLRVENDTAGALVRRIKDGEAFDVAVLTPEALSQLTQAGTITPDSIVKLARVSIGVAIRQGQAAPDISTVDAFRKSLLDARKVAYIDPAAGGSSGIYLAKLFDRLGIAAQVRDKAVLVPGGLVAQRVVSGEADIGIHQISEILAVPGALLVGPLPADIQNETVYAGGIAAASGKQSAAKAFLDLLGSASAKSVLKSKGMDAP